MAGGCKAKNPIVGQWAGSEPSIMGGNMDLTADFGADGTYKISVGSGQAAIATQGTYTYDDSTKQLTLKQEKVTMGGNEIKVSGSSDISLGPSGSSPVTWVGDGEIKAKFGMTEMDLKRK